MFVCCFFIVFKGPYGIRNSIKVLMVLGTVGKALPKCILKTKKDDNNNMDISAHCYSFSFNFKLNCLKITVNVNFTTKRAGREVSKETESHTNVLN